jgi:hypothetical protein
VALREEASESRRRNKAASRAEQDIDILRGDTCLKRRLVTASHAPTSR